MKLERRIALVTGAAQGIGQAIARALAREGAKVAVTDINQEQASKTASEIQKSGFVAEAFQLDVSSKDSVEDVVGKTVDKFGGLNILVNNAGITDDALFLRLKDEQWDRVMNVNLKGAFLCARAVGRVLLKQENSRIINIASVVGISGNAGQANYAASKAGIIGLTKTLAKELASRNITVNAIAPGFIQTAMTDKLNQKVIEKVKEGIPLKRLGLPEDIAQMAVFLASDDAAYITGQVINVDGGMVM